METKTFDATLDRLHEIINWVRSYGEGVGLGARELHKVQLALEEVLVNVISYSYDNRGGVVTITLDIHADRLSITVADRGKAFNPIARRPRLPQNHSLEERSLGGLGILLITTSMDEVSYQRRENQNILTMIKKKQKPIVRENQG